MLSYSSDQFKFGFKTSAREYSDNLFSEGNGTFKETYITDAHNWICSIMKLKILGLY